MTEDRTPETLDALIKADIEGLSNSEALEHIGRLIDIAFNERSVIGTSRAFELLGIMNKRELSEGEKPLLHYFRANAWENKRLEKNSQQSWAWEQPETQEQILELQRAVRCQDFSHLPLTRQCQILTNLANQLSSIGRFIEAISLWDRVLSANERFAMAHGNRGIALYSYARALYDPGHTAVLQVAGYDALRAATSSDAFYDSAGLDAARAQFEELKAAISRQIDIGAVRQRIDLEGYSIGETVAERAYRAWCLKERLFINPLNDLGGVAIAAQDILTLPSLTAPATSSQMPSLIGFFNQMKQEFVSARYLYFEGLHSDEPHFSDQDVLLYNTLDYPAYSLAVEKMRMAFRMAYSLFDKIAFFLNAYLEIDRTPTKVNFRTIWYEQKDKQPSLLSRFTASENWPLRGLFWLSKDFFEEEFQNVTEPDAKALATIRHHLEHKYLQLHESWAENVRTHRNQELIAKRPAYALSRDEFSARTLRLLQLVRGALIYLSLAVYREEQLRAQASESHLTISMPLSLWEDDWKR